MKTFTLHLDAGHDTNGNPRRCYVVFDDTGRIVETIDEGYQGNSLVKKRYPGSVNLGTIATTPAQRRELLKGEK